MIPFPFIVLGISATTLGVRHWKKKTSRKEIDENRKDFEAWCRRQRLVPKADGVFDLNAHLPNGNPLIIEALIQGRNDIFEYLIAQHADVNAMNSEGKTALFNCKNSDQIEKLIQAGADVNARDLQGRTVLFYCRNVPIADVLLKNGVDLLIQDKEGKTVLHTLSTTKKDLKLSLRFARIYVRHTDRLLIITDNMEKKAEICELYLNEKKYEEPLDDEDKKMLSNLSDDALLDYAVDKG